MHTPGDPRGSGIVKVEHRRYQLFMVPDQPNQKKGDIQCYRAREYMFKLGVIQLLPVKPSLVFNSVLSSFQ